MRAVYELRARIWRALEAVQDGDTDYALGILVDLARDAGRAEDELDDDELEAAA